MLQEVADIRCRPEEVGVDLRAGDQAPLPGEALEQTLIAHELVVGGGAPRDGAQDPFALEEDVPGWIAKGRRLGAAGDHCSGGSAGRLRVLRSEEKNALTLLQ